MIRVQGSFYERFIAAVALMIAFQGLSPAQITSPSGANSGAILSTSATPSLLEVQAALGLANRLSPPAMEPESCLAKKRSSVSSEPAGSASKWRYGIDVPGSKERFSGNGLYHAYMAEPVVIEKVYGKDEDRFILLAMPDREHPGDPFMRTSTAMTKEEITKLFQEQGMPDSEIERLIAQAGNARAER